jgi:uncharacterized membrane protein
VHAIAEFVKTTLVGGILVVLPVYLLVLLLAKTLTGLLAFISPVTAQIPAGVEYRQIAALGIIFAVCFVAGILVRTRPGSIARSFVEDRVLARIPGYQILRGLTRKLAGGEGEASFTPCFVEIEDGALAPAFIIEELPDGRYTVMVPSVPTPAAGALFVIQRERVHPLAVPLPAMFRTISQFGSGTGALVAALQAQEESDARVS